MIARDLYEINVFFCVPQASYLGVTPQDIIDYKLKDATHPLEEVDIKRAKDALKNDPFIRSHKPWRDAIEQMLKMGVELHELSPTRVRRNLRLGMFGSTHGRLHAKTAVIDRKQVFIGSMNFDPRSEKHNTEMGIFIDSPQLAREVLRLMDLDKLQASYRLRLAPGTDNVQWLAVNDDELIVLDEEPDVDFWTLFWLGVLSPLAACGDSPPAWLELSRIWRGAPWPWSPIMMTM